MRLNRAIVLAVALAPTWAWAQDSYKVEVLKEGPPATLAAEIKATLASQGYRVTDDQGKPVAEFWLRKAIPARGKPAGPQGAVQFPFLAEGEVLGALRYPVDGHDNRDQTIAPGVYTVRYGLQPVNGDHLGVSTYRDYALLVPAAKDTKLAELPQKQLETQSAEAAGTSHPAVHMLLAAPEGAKGDPPSMAKDETKNMWGVVVPLSLTVKGESAPVALPIQIVLVGSVM